MFRNAFCWIMSLLDTSQRFEPYDLRRVVASAYFAVHTPIDKLLLLGGWKSSTTVMQFYIDNLALDADLVGFFSWLKHDVIQPVALEAESRLASAQRAKKPRLVLDL